MQYCGPKKAVPWPYVCSQPQRDTVTVVGTDGHDGLSGERAAGVSAPSAERRNPTLATMMGGPEPGRGKREPLRHQTALDGR